MVNIYREEDVTIEEYVIALNILPTKPLNLLLTLYDNAPDHSASEEELSHKMGYKDNHASSLQIGKVGKRIADILSKTPNNNYSTGPAWFHFIGGRYWNEKPSKKTDERWEMTENLCKAIETLRKE